MANQTGDHAVPILVVEDNLPDYQTMTRAFKKLGINSPVYHCETGEEALDFLNHRGKYSDGKNAPRPGIVWLDLNLPGTDGREVLQKIKSNPELKSIPVIVFTTSDAEQDIDECYQNGANSYITKPVDLKKLFEIVDSFKSYWFQIVALPGPAPTTST
jgi:CheY-like chemotaxis protein